MASMGKRGPKTERGKALVRRNAVTHGLLSESPVVDGVESPEEWERHRERVLADLETTGYIEGSLAEVVAQCLWRLRRVPMIERASIATEQKSAIDGLAVAARYAKGVFGTPIEETITPERVDRLVRRQMAPKGGGLELLQRYEAHLSRQLYKALHELEAMKARRRGEAAPLARLEVHGE